MGSLYQFAYDMLGHIPGPVFIVQFLFGLGLSLVIAVTYTALFTPGGSIARRNPEGEPPLTSEEIGLMRGGRTLAINSVIASLLHWRVLTSSGRRGQFELSSGGEDYVKSDLGKAIIMPLQVGSRAGLSTLHQSAHPCAQRMHQDLTRRGLMLSSGARLFNNMISHLPMIFVLVLGGLKTWLGLSRGKPTVFLILAMIAGVAVLAWRMISYTRMTKRGKQLVRESIQSHKSLKTSAGSKAANLNPSDVGLAVALFGLTSLDATAFAVVRNTLAPPSSSGGDGGFFGCGGGGCGGGGCGGGGCGGCGS